MLRISWLTANWRLFVESSWVFRVMTLPGPIQLNSTGQLSDHKNVRRQLSRVELDDVVTALHRETWGPDNRHDTRPSLKIRLILTLFLIWLTWLWICFSLLTVLLLYAWSYTLCPKKRPPFYFLVTLSKVNRFNDFWCEKIVRKFVINSLYICPPHLYTVTTLPREIQKSHFSTILFIHTSDLGHSVYKLFLVWTRMDVYKHFFSNRVLEPWNSFPAEPHHFSTLPAFKTFLKSVDLSKFVQCQ